MAQRDEFSRKNRHQDTTEQRRVRSRSSQLVRPNIVEHYVGNAAFCNMLPTSARLLILGAGWPPFGCMRIL